MALKTARANAQFSRQNREQTASEQSGAPVSNEDSAPLWPYVAVAVTGLMGLEAVRQRRRETEWRRPTQDQDDAEMLVNLPLLAPLQPDSLLRFARPNAPTLPHSFRH